MARFTVVQEHEREGNKVSRHVRRIAEKPDENLFDFSKGVYALSKTTYTEKEVEVLNLAEKEFQRVREEMIVNLAGKEKMSVEEFKKQLEDGDINLSDYGITDINSARELFDYTGVLVEGVEIEDFRIEFFGSRYTIEVEGDLFSIERTIGEGKVFNSNFIVDDSAPKGTGLRIFANQIANLEDSYKFYGIATNAARNTRLNGYYTWARYGYEMDKTFNKLSENLQGTPFQYNEFGEEVNSFKELFSTQEGRDHWKEEGTSFSGWFCLDQWTEIDDRAEVGTDRLNNYLRYRGLPTLP